MRNFKVLLLMAIFGLSEQVLGATSIDKLLEQQQVRECRKSISKVADQVVKANKHRFYRAPSAAQNKPFSVLGVIEYRDRNSHLNITTSRSVNGGCNSTVVESFVVPHPCVIAREEVFKKWLFVGKLSAATMVLSSTKEPAKKAYLSNAVDGSICLISTQFTVVEH